MSTLSKLTSGKINEKRLIDVEKKNMGDETWQTKANKAVPRYYSPVELLSMRVERLEQDIRNLRKELNL